MRWFPNLATAISFVALATAAAMLGDFLIGFPPLILFAASVVFSLMLGGRFGAAAAALLATLCTDYLFVPPRYHWTLDGVVLRLGLCYLATGAAAAIFTRRSSQLS
jgi:K+-sensing histidine kinase KdpD